MSPHLVWLVQNDFAVRLCRATRKAFSWRARLYSEAAAVPGVATRLAAALARHRTLHLAKPSRVQFAPARVDAFDRRIIFAACVWSRRNRRPCFTLVAGRQAIAMWGYPLWLFIGLWLVMRTPKFEPGDADARCVSWGISPACFVGAFNFHFGVRPHFGQRYFAELFPQVTGSDTMSSRFRAITGQPLAYVLGDI